MPDRRGDESMTDTERAQHDELVAENVEAERGLLEVVARAIENTRRFERRHMAKLANDYARFDQARRS